MMAYEYEHRLKNRLLDLEFDTWEETVQFEREYRELERVYRKAKAWDRMYDMIIDEGMTIGEFDDEMYELLKQTGKTDIRIITDPSIRMEDE